MLLMRIKHPILSYLTIVNVICYIEHSNQIKTSRRCTKPAHPKQRFNEADFPPMDSSQSTQSTPDETDTFIEIEARSRRALTEAEHQTKTASTSNQTEQQSTSDDDDSDDGSSSTSP